VASQAIPMHDCMQKFWTVQCLMGGLENVGDNALVANRVEESLEQSTDPTIMAIVAYWSGLKGSILAPAWVDWDWMAIPSEAIRHCGVVDVIGNSDDLDFVYRFWGGAHASANKLEMTGKSVKSMRPREEMDQVFSQYKACYERQSPCLFNVTLRYKALDIAIEERSLRLPFVGDDGEVVSHLLAYSYISGDTESVRRVLVESNRPNESD
jgi:hypothetical protein